MRLLDMLDPMGAEAANSRYHVSKHYNNVISDII